MWCTASTQIIPLYWFILNWSNLKYCSSKPSCKTLRERSEKCLKSIIWIGARLEKGPRSILWITPSKIIKYLTYPTIQVEKVLVHFHLAWRSWVVRSVFADHPHPRPGSSGRTRPGRETRWWRSSFRLANALRKPASGHWHHWWWWSPGTSNWTCFWYLIIWRDVLRLGPCVPS